MGHRQQKILTEGMVETEDCILLDTGVDNGATEALT
jgi:hypothetical protein